MCYLVLLDFSKAFDVIDHNILIEKLANLGFSKCTFTWIVSYLRGRKICTEYNGDISDFDTTNFGVPQGSLLAPLLFNLCVLDLKHDFCDTVLFQYADDIQAVFTDKYDNQEKIHESIATFINNMNTWAKKHNLKLNEGKTQILPIHGKRSAHKLMTPKETHIQQYIITEAKNLGIIMSSTMSWTKQIEICTNSCYKMIYVVRQFFKQFFPRNKYVKLKLQIVNSLILSKFTWFLSMMYPMNERDVKIIKHLLKRACSTVLGRYCGTK